MLDLHHLHLGKTDPKDILSIDASIAHELQSMMQQRGYYAGALNGNWDEATQKAFREFAGVENVEDRLLEGARIDRVVLGFLRTRFG